MSKGTTNAARANMHGDISDDQRTVLFGILADIETFGELDQTTRESDAFESIRTKGIRYQPAEWLGRRLTLAERKAFSRTTRRLEARGLIERIFEKQRARVASVRPTEDGLRTALQLVPEANRHCIAAGLASTTWGHHLFSEGLLHED